MPKLRINDHGVLVDAESGEPLDGDAAIEIDGLADLLKEARAAAGLRSEVKSLRAKKGAALGDSSELQRQLEEVTQERDDLQARVAKLSPYEKQVERLTRDLQKATETATKQETLRRQEMMRSAIIKAAVAAGFEDPDDALLRLEKAVKFTPRLVDGKPTDDLDLLFAMPVVDKDGKSGVQEMDVDAAVAEIAKRRPSLIPGDARGGPQRGASTPQRQPGSMGELQRAIEEAEAKGDRVAALRFKNQFEDAKRGGSHALKVA